MGTTVTWTATGGHVKGRRGPRRRWLSWDGVGTLSGGTWRGFAIILYICFCVARVEATARPVACEFLSSLFVCNCTVQTEHHVMTPQETLKTGETASF